MDSLPSLDLANYFSGNKILPGSEPIAQAYAGHQFGHFVPILGDGRAILLGELIDRSGQRKDLQLKGSGRTRFSRNGDGRAWIGPVIREYIISEAMHKLGIATTRSLAVVSTGESIYRERKLPGAILTRVASSHIRIGSFEYFASQKNYNAVKALADYSINRHYPEIQDDQSKYLKFFTAICKKQIKLITNWISVGFIHGVMNTDNTSICGETIDYGPCAWMDFFDQNQVFSSIDHYGRYSYSNQANICLWNLSCLANTLITLIAPKPEDAIALCQQVLEKSKIELDEQISSSFLNKIGLEIKNAVNFQLSSKFLELMHQYRADFTLSFRLLSELVDPNHPKEELLKLFDQEGHQEVQNWLSQWHIALSQEGLNTQTIQEQMKERNPAYIPRNHLIEKIILDFEQEGSSALLNDLEQCLNSPYQEHEQYLKLMQAPSHKDLSYMTFCGT